MRGTGVLGQVEDDTGDVAEVGESGLGPSTVDRGTKCGEDMVFFLFRGWFLTGGVPNMSSTTTCTIHPLSSSLSLSLSLNINPSAIAIRLYNNKSKRLVVDAKEIWRCTGHSWTIKFWLFQQGLRRKPWPIHSFSHLPWHPKGAAVVSGRFSSNKHDIDIELFISKPQAVWTNCLKLPSSPWKIMKTFFRYPKQLHGKKKTKHKKNNLFRWKTVPTNQDTLDSWVASYVVMLHHFVPT